MRPLKTVVLLLILVPALIAGTGIFYSHAGPPPDESFQARVEDLNGNKYLPKVLGTLQGAGKSIFMAMYFVGFDPLDKKTGVNQLVEELINARKRGVAVKVILDQNIDFSAWDAGAGEWVKDEKNTPLFVYLKHQGIDVYFDDLFTVTHSKLIIIDEEIVILGSANWSESSLRKNRESSCLIRSRDVARRFLEYFSGITVDHEASILDEERGSPVRLGNDFLADPSLGSRMLEAHDEIAFDLYLFLLRNFNGEPGSSIAVDYQKFIPALGLAQKEYAAAKIVLKSALQRLQQRYRLISLKDRSPRETAVVLLNYPDSSPYSLPREKYLSVPDEYWSYGWHTRFSFPEKYCYLIALSKEGPRRGRVWREYMTGMKKEFNIGRKTMWGGMRGLKELNIIDMEYSTYTRENGVIKRGPGQFRVLGLYSPQLLEEDKARLAKTYGEDSFRKAVAYASAVFKANDIQVIEDIIEKTEEYDAAQVDRAFRIVSAKSADNPKRSYKYVVGILQKESR